MSLEISLVIPAFNEARYLPRLLETVQASVDASGFAPDRIEIVVADNGSTDDTSSIAAAYGCRVVVAVPRMIGAVRNSGARAARGRILAFIDADSQLHPGTVRAIERFFEDDTRIVGVSGVVPERDSPGIKATWCLFASVSILLGFARPLSWGECVPSGVVCCRREDWDVAGGYSERMLFAEDAWFLMVLKRLGRRRGQTVGWLGGVPAVFSARKFDEHGDWHYFLFPLRFLAGVFWPPALHRWVHRYWYGAQRGRDD